MKVCLIFFFILCIIFYITKEDLQYTCNKYIDFSKNIFQYITFSNYNNLSVALSTDSGFRKYDYDKYNFTTSERKTKELKLFVYI